jgi:predicted small secreted protein
MTAKTSLTTKISKGIATLVALCALLLTGCDNPNEDEGNNQDVQQEQNGNNGEEQENEGGEQGGGENEGGGNQQDGEGGEADD